MLHWITGVTSVTWISFDFVPLCLWWWALVIWIMIAIIYDVFNFFFHGATGPSGLGPPHYRGFTIALRHTLSVGLLWTSDQSDPETSTSQYSTHKRQTSMPTTGFEPTIPASQMPQIHAWDRAATNIGLSSNSYIINCKRPAFERRERPFTTKRAKY
jgi:hypothetical protein